MCFSNMKFKNFNLIKIVVTSAKNVKKKNIPQIWIKIIEKAFMYEEKMVNLIVLSNLYVPTLYTDKYLKNPHFFTYIIHLTNM